MLSTFPLSINLPFSIQCVFKLGTNRIFMSETGKRTAEEVGQPHGVGGPPTKKMKIEGSTEEDKNPVVVFQKFHMSLRIKELNRALDEARGVQANTEQVRDAFLDQVAVVDRHWAQFDAILVNLLQRVPTAPEPSTENEHFQARLTAAMKGIAPSIMERCLRAKAMRLTKAAQEESDHIEERATFTRLAVEKLVGAIVAQEEEMQKLRGQLQGGATDTALAQQNEQLNKRLVTLQAQHDDLTATSLEAQKEIKDFKNTAIAAREKLAEAVIERDQLEAKLTLAERKLDKLGGSITAPAPAGPLMAAQTTESKGPSASPKLRFKKAAAKKSHTDISQLQEENTKLKEKVHKLDSLAASRLQEINEYGVQRESILRELMTLRKQRETVTEEKILGSPHYLSMKNSFQALDQEFKVAVETMSNRLKVANLSLADTQNELQNALKTAADQTIANKEEIAKYQEEVLTLKKNLEAAQKSASEVKPTEEKASEGSQILSTQQSQLASMRETVGQLRTENSTLKTQVNELQSTVASLSLQLTEKDSQITRLQKEHQTLTEGLKSTEQQEKSALHEQLTKLEKHFNVLAEQSSGDQKASWESVLQTIKKVDDLEAQVASLQEQVKIKQKEIEEMKSAVQTQKDESNAYLGEIDEISKELDQVQEQNVRLVEQKSDKDESNQRLVKECIDLKSMKNLLSEQITLLKEELENTQQKCTKQDELYQAELTVSKNLRDQMKALQKELNVKANQMDIQQKKLNETTEKSNDLQIQLAGAKSRLDEMVMNDESVISYNQEAMANKRLQEKNAALKKRLDRLRSDSILEEELRQAKSLLICPCCNERQKNAVIAKCYHVFCRECIQHRVTTRSRKCPGCSKPFSETDVHDIYLNFSAN